MITLEQVDQMRKRTNCSYEEAKFFLEKHNGNVLEAIVDFERTKNSTKNVSYSSSRHGNDFWQSVAGLIRKGFETRVIIEDRNNNAFVSMPVNIMLLFMIFASYIVIPALLILLLLGYKLTIRKSAGEVVNISSLVQEAAGKMTKEVSNVPQKKDETPVTSEEMQNSYNEITIE